MEKKCLLREDDYSMWREEGISNEVIEFLDNINWGSGGTIYQHKKTEERIEHLHNPSMITMYSENDEGILGTGIICNIDVLTAQEVYNCYYLRYFASSPKIRGKGVTSRMGRQVMKFIQDGVEGKAVFTGCVEAANKRSYNIGVSAGYRNLGTIKTVGFSRYFPKKNKNIEQVNTEEARGEVIELLKDKYKAHSLVQFYALFNNDNYYVIRENGKIIAGVQYHKVHWVVDRMPGLMGKIVINIVPYIPVINKMFNPRKFEFLAFEGVYVEEGREDVLYKLFEGLLAKENLKSGLIWMHEKCPVYLSLKNYGKLGLINNFVKDSNVYVLAAFRNMSDEEEKIFDESPIYASAFDFI